MTVTDTPIYTSLAARLTDPPTSHAAAPPLGKVWLIQSRIHDILAEYGPLTHDEIHARYTARHGYGRGSSKTSIRTRTSELHERGGVRAMDRAGVTPSGRSATRWDIHR